MAGNSQRKGATRKSAKGNPTAGSGGRRRKGLEGKGPTPKAEDRPYHKKHKMAQAAAKRQQAKPRRRTRGADDGPQWVAGRNPVLELLVAEVPLIAVYVAQGVERDQRVREILERAVGHAHPIIEVPRTELDTLTSGAVHQGVAAKLPAYEYATLDDVLGAAAERAEPPLVVVLDQITDPRNLGAVVRSASGFGVHGVVIAERRAAQMTAAAWKTSAGAAARVPVARVTNLTRAIKELQDAGLMVIGLAADGDVELPGLELATGPLAIVVGSEGRGLSRLVSENCDQVVSIPMASELESLNAGVAAGICLYQISRLRAAAD